MNDHIFGQSKDNVMTEDVRHFFFTYHMGHAAESGERNVSVLRSKHLLLPELRGVLAPSGHDDLA